MPPAASAPSIGQQPQVVKGFLSAYLSIAAQGFASVSGRPTGAQAGLAAHYAPTSPHASSSCAVVDGELVGAGGD